MSSNTEAQKNLNKNEKKKEKKTARQLDKEQFGLCRICENKANGIHYGVASCEGCKGFYYRTVLQKKLYKCFYNNDCTLFGKDRKKCKACRFKKCLETGMSINGIKMGRISIVDKLKLKESRMQNENISNFKNEPSSCMSSYSFEKTYSSKKSIESEENSNEIMPAELSQNEENFLDYFSSPNRNDVIDESYSKNREFDDDNDSFQNDLNSSKSDEVNELIKNLEEDLIIFHDNKSELVNLYDKENHIRKYYNLEYFLKSSSKVRESANLLTNSSYEDLFFNVANENILYILVVIREKVNQVYQEFLVPLVDADENKVSNNQNENENKGWILFKDFLINSASKFIPFVKELPGFEDMSPNDLSLLVNDNTSMLFRFRFCKLFVNNEFHLVLDNIRIDRNLLNQIFGNKICDNMFEFIGSLNSLNLTNHEIGLFVPYLLTITEAPLEDITVNELNMVYARALLYEFSLNNRDGLFINKIIEIIGMVQVTKALKNISLNDCFQNIRKE